MKNVALSFLFRKQPTMRPAIYLIPLAFLIAACTPTVQVQAPDKPIEINLNVNIEQRIKIEIQKDVQEAIAKNPDLF